MSMGFLAFIHDKDCIYFTFLRENRYLLFLTENYAALNILKHYINIGFDSKDSSNQPYILFGSSFPKDKDYTHVGLILYIYLTCLYAKSK